MCLFLILFLIIPHSFLVWIQSSLSLTDMQKAGLCTSSNKVCCEYLTNRENIEKHTITQALNDPQKGEPGSSTQQSVPAEHNFTWNLTLIQRITHSTKGVFSDPGDCFFDWSLAKELYITVLLESVGRLCNPLQG